MRFSLCFVSALVVLALASTSCGGEAATQGPATAPTATASRSPVEIIRETELARIKALTELDIEKAEALHADDFRLKAPNGETFTKDEYLEAVRSGRLDYVLWEPISPVEVTVQGDEASVVYRSRIGFAGSFGGTTEQTHNDTYALRGGKWLIVRSVTVFD